MLGPAFSVSKGKAYLAKEALKVAPVWHATSLQDKKQVKLRIEGLDPALSYHFGWSWWDYGNGGRTQSMAATSVDGEARSQLSKPVVLPGWKHDKAPAVSRVAALPSKVNLDGTVTIIAEKPKGPSVVLSEAWLYGSSPSPELEIDEGRRVELEKFAPEGTSLIAYFSASNRKLGKKEGADLQAEIFLMVAPSLRAIGYFNNTQNRHRAETHLVREELVEPATIDWASVLCLEDAEGGLALVKESHKCVNQSGLDQEASFERAKENEVLDEIDSVADLGLDALQIDDGWQVERMKPKSESLRDWRPCPDWYPKGWTNVVARAKEKNVDLGIWFAARAPLEDLTWSFDQAGFETYKFDFANLSRYGGVESYLAKGRGLVAHSKHQAKVNWDVTENAPRFGCFWARECGSIWLANRNPMRPDSVVPRPWLMLRETWELARYMNNKKFELPIQNFRTVNQKISDAHQHSDTYSVALGLSGVRSETR